MLDIEALEAAGFQKLMTTEKWESVASSQVPLNNYFLARGEVLITTEQNTHEQSAHGISTTVRYPEIAIVHHAIYARRVTCDAANTDLILALAEEVGADRKRATDG